MKEARSLCLYYTRIKLSLKLYTKHIRRHKAIFRGFSKVFLWSRCLWQHSILTKTDKDLATSWICCRSHRQLHQCSWNRWTPGTQGPPHSTSSSLCRHTYSSCRPCSCHKFHNDSSQNSFWAPSGLLCNLSVSHRAWYIVHSVGSCFFRICRSHNPRRPEKFESWK